jgi:hypothetical protein
VPANECDPVGSDNIAGRLGVQRDTVKMWKHRGLLPNPRWTISGRPAWNWPDIEMWSRETGRSRTIRYAAADKNEYRFTVVGPASAEVIHVPKWLVGTEERLGWIDPRLEWSPHVDGRDPVMIVPLDDWLRHMGTGIGPGLLLPGAAADLSAAIAQRFRR